jgi:hypothetical protein
MVHIDTLGNMLWTSRESFENTYVGDENLTEFDGNRILLSGTWHETKNNQGYSTKGFVRLYDKSSGAEKTSYWRVVPSYVATLQAIKLTGGEIMGLTTGPLLATYPQGLFLKFDWNNPPQIMTPSSDCPSQIKEDQKTELNIIVKDDFPNDRIRFHARCAELSDITIDSITGKLTIFPNTESDHGKKEIIVLATDQVGQSDSVKFQTEVEPVNDPPYLTSLKYVFIVTDPSQPNPKITVRIVMQLTEPEGDAFSKELTGNRGVINWSSDTCFLHYAYDQKQSDTLSLLLTDGLSAASNYKVIVDFKTNSVRFVNAKDLVDTASINRFPPGRSISRPTSTNLQEAIAYYDLRGRLLTFNQGDLNSVLKRKCVIVAKYLNKSKIYIVPGKGYRRNIAEE